MRNLTTCILTIAILTQFIGIQPALGNEESEAAKYWNNFRGPTGNGVSLTANPPTKWSASENVAWQTEIPGRGSSSPIVWGDKVFLTTAVKVDTKEQNDLPQQQLNRGQLMQKFDEDGDGQLSVPERTKAAGFIRDERQKTLAVHQFSIICLDRNTGKVLWNKVAAERKPRDGHHEDHGYASASPVTDGEFVYASFGSNGIFCYDFDGNKVWERTDPGEMQTRGGFGEGSSLALFGDVLVLPWDHEGQSRIESIDKKTGETIWSVDRDEPSTWSTPRIVSIDGRQQIIMPGENYSRGYDLKTGDEIWRSSGLSSRPVASPVVKDHIGYFASSRQGSSLRAFRLDKQGDISNDPVWKIQLRTPDCPSLLLSDNRLFYVADNKGIISCANADDGSELFAAQRLEGIGGIYSSPVAADSKVFVTGRGGTTVVINDSMEFIVIGQNDIGEPVDATLALAGDQIFIRGSKHLFCIQENQ